jgi:nucleotide-binding universal stress UspA family protein
MRTCASAGFPRRWRCAAAETGGYDLLVVGSRGLGPVGRLLLGSVSAELTRRSPIPVLVAGQDKTERIEPLPAG